MKKYAYNFPKKEILTVFFATAFSAFAIAYSLYIETASEHDFLLIAAEILLIAFLIFMSLPLWNLIVKREIEIDKEKIIIPSLFGKKFNSVIERSQINKIERKLFKNANQL